MNEQSESKYLSEVGSFESPEDFEIDDNFMKRMDVSKEVKLEDYLRLIGSQSTIVDNNDFDFGYDITEIEEHSLPNSKVGDININITKSEANVRNRRRRKR